MSSLIRHAWLDCSSRSAIKRIAASALPRNSWSSVDPSTIRASPSASSSEIGSAFCSRTTRPNVSMSIESTHAGTHASDPTPAPRPVFTLGKTPSKHESFPADLPPTPNIRPAPRPGSDNPAVQIMDRPGIAASSTDRTAGADQAGGSRRHSRKRAPHRRRRRRRGVGTAPSAAPGQRRRTRTDVGTHHRRVRICHAPAPRSVRLRGAPLLERPSSRQLSSQRPSGFADTNVLGR